MVAFAAFGVVLVFGLLVLGPHMTTWIGNAVGHKTVVTWIWWIAQWPLLIAGVVVACAGIYHLGPNVRHPRWQFLSFGSLFGIAVWLCLSGAFSACRQFGDVDVAGVGRECVETTAPGISR